VSEEGDSSSEEEATAEEVREVLSGQLCRCTGYENIVKSVLWAAEHGTADE